MNNNTDALLAAADRSMDLAVRYGVNETNPIWASESTHENVDFEEYVTLSDPRLARITRVRLLTEPGYPYYDISYIYGVLKDGRHIRLADAPMHLSRRAPKADLIAWAKAEKVFAKGLGLLDEGNWSILK
jgi:hypothetical protein